MRVLSYTALVAALLTSTGAAVATGDPIKSLTATTHSTVAREPRTRFLRVDDLGLDDLDPSDEEDEERARLGYAKNLLKERKALLKELNAAAAAREKLKIPTVSVQQNKFAALFKSGLSPKRARSLGKFKTRLEANRYEKFYKLAKDKLAAKARMARMRGEN